jgi:hypothetical protein
LQGVVYGAAAGFALSTAVLQGPAVLSRALLNGLVGGLADVVGEVLVQYNKQTIGQANVDPSVVFNADSWNAYVQTFFKGFSSSVTTAVFSPEDTWFDPIIRAGALKLGAAFVEGFDASIEAGGFQPLQDKVGGSLFDALLSGVLSVIVRRGYDDLPGSSTLKDWLVFLVKSMFGGGGKGAFKSFYSALTGGLEWGRDL